MDTSLISNCTIVFMAPEKGAASLKNKHKARETTRKQTVEQNIQKYTEYTVLDLSRFIYLHFGFNHDSAWFVHGFKHFDSVIPDQTSCLSNWKLLSFLFDLSFARKRRAGFRHTAFIGRNARGTPRSYLHVPTAKRRTSSKNADNSIRIKL